MILDNHLKFFKMSRYLKIYANKKRRIFAYMAKNIYYEKQNNVEMVFVNIN